MKTQVELHELIFDVEYDYTPGEPASFNYPGCDEQIEITEIKIGGQDASMFISMLDLYDDIKEEIRKCL